MTFKELCEARYSVRAYKNEPIDAEKLAYVLECARLAPSAVNRQPWRLHVLTSPNDLAKACECYNREWIRTAPAVIAVTVMRNEAWVRSIDGKFHGDIDAAIITEHICLAAAEQGLGTCWVCNFNADRFHTLMNLPADEQPVALIPIGSPASSPTPKSRRPLSEITNS